ncbi:MAG TPA: potassium channel protein [Polyangiaceae bacterium]|nr:potassium channel protein [Polyangiaceae bacterium]
MRGTNTILRRMAFAVALVAGVIGAGGLALYALGDGLWTLGEALYMAVISVSTVGFGELPSIDRVRGARSIIVATILTGLVAVAYFQSTMTALIVEGVIGEAWRSKRMKKSVDALAGHIVIAGVGSTGKHVVEELTATRTPFVAIDRDRENLERVSQEVCGGKMLYVHGDATEDHSLLEAGIGRAAGVIAALTHDKDNLYVTLSARTLNARARIVAKVVEPEAIAKMARAGANATVSPNIIGGRRMASELIRPEVTEFLDQMLRDKERALRLEEVSVPHGSGYAGKALREVPIRRESNALVVAVRDAQRNFLYNPGPDHCLAEGSVLVVLGDPTNVEALRRMVERSVDPSA